MHPLPPAFRRHFHISTPSFLPPPPPLTPFVAYSRLPHHPHCPSFPRNRWRVEKWEKPAHNNCLSHDQEACKSSCQKPAPFLPRFLAKTCSRFRQAEARPLFPLHFHVRFFKDWPCAIVALRFPKRSLPPSGVLCRGKSCMPGLKRVSSYAYICFGSALPFFYCPLSLTPIPLARAHIGIKGGALICRATCATYQLVAWSSCLAMTTEPNCHSLPSPPGGSKVTKLIKSFPPSTERSPISLATPPSLVLAASRGGGFSTSCQISPVSPVPLHKFPFSFPPPTTPLPSFSFPLSPPPPYPPFSRRVHCPHDPASESWIERSGGCRRERERRESKSACFAVSPTANPGLTAGCPPSSSSTRACQDLLLLPVFSVLSPAGGPRRRRRRSRYT